MQRFHATSLLLKLGHEIPTDAKDIEKTNLILGVLWNTASCDCILGLNIGEDFLTKAWRAMVNVKEVLVVVGRRGQASIYREHKYWEINGNKRLPQSGRALWDDGFRWISAVIATVDDLRWSKHMCIPKGDRSVLETIANVATSVPFVLVGLQTPRKKFACRMYGNSMIGVGIASSLYHASRGDARRIFRFCDYAMIATSTVCLSSAIRSEKHNPKALVMASALMIPFQPMVVTALHTGLMEAQFALKTRENPKFRRAHSVHTMSSIFGGALFVANGFFPDTPYVHAAWHLAAAVGVATLRAMLQD